MLNRSETLLGLSGLLLPIHLKPQPDELLSSWLIRLAHGQGLKLQTFCSLVFGRDKSIWNRDIDKLAPDWLITRLSECTGTSMSDVWGSTLKSYEGVLYEHHQPNGNTKWILPLGLYHRTRHGHGLQYCPHCLAEDAEPYFRKRWRLALSTICTKHGCYLLDACPQCASPLAPHRTDMHGRQYSQEAGLNAHCWKCNFDFRWARTTEVKDSASATLQLQLEFALEHGNADWAGNPAMHSVVLFEGLRELIAGLTSKNTRVRLKNSVKLQGHDLNDWPHKQFEMNSQIHRRESFHLLAMVLENWPTSFIDLIHECGLRYADLKGDSEQRMYWYEKVIQLEAGGGYAAIGSDEASSIINAVISKHGKFSQGKARRLSGRDISSHLQEREVHPVSDDVYEELMTSIDHQIAGTLDKTERACLIRDKVMFAVGRQLCLREGALADLTIEQVRALVSDEVNLDFSDVARTPAQARAWVEWYWESVRPELRPRFNVVNVFTSPTTKREFSHSAVSMRFHSLVNSAMLERKIQSYACWGN